MINLKLLDLKKRFLPFLFVSICTTAFGQFHQDVFPNLQGDDLRIALAQNYKPGIVYPYGPARDTLYSRVWGKNDSLKCIYTGHTLYMNPQLDPTDAVFMNGDNNGINTEHMYPQSKGAANGNAKSDMHHLAPCRVLVNSTRGSNPYDEISDTATDLWHFMSISTSVTPSQNIRDNYSESRTGSFEPREGVKGDVARAIFYFYTMYRNEANNADPNYFDTMKDDLCQWHLDDPADEEEYDRTMKIASYQDGKVNPFILDCTLAERMYCNNSCTPIPMAMDDLANQLIDNFEVAPNPFDSVLEISFSLSEKTDLKLQLFDMIGNEVVTFYDAPTHAGMFKRSYNLEEFNKSTTGIYILKMTITDGTKSSVLSKKLIQLPR